MWFAALTAPCCTCARMEGYEIYRFCEDNVYPWGLSKDQKRNVHRKCHENLKIDDRQLYYIASSTHQGTSSITLTVMYTAIQRIEADTENFEVHNQVDRECGMEESQNHTHCEGAEMQEPGSQPHCDNDADMQESVNQHDSESEKNLGESQKYNPKHIIVVSILSCKFIVYYWYSLYNFTLLFHFLHASSDLQYLQDAEEKGGIEECFHPMPQSMEMSTNLTPAQTVPSLSMTPSGQHVSLTRCSSIILMVYTCHTAKVHQHWKLGTASCYINCT